MKHLILIVLLVGSVLAIYDNLIGFLGCFIIVFVILGINLVKWVNDDK